MAAPKREWHTRRAWRFLLTGVSGTSRSGGAPSQFTATAVAEIVATGELQSHVYNTLQPAYASRYRLMMAAIEKHLLPLGVELPRTLSSDIVGGYFIWMDLPHPLSAVAVSRRARSAENLIVAEGEMFQVPGDTSDALFPRSLRLCFAWEDEHALDEGVSRLARVVRQMMREGSGAAETMQQRAAHDPDRKDQSGFW